jgi:transcriptional regulator with XRE-family HTH domain
MQQHDKKILQFNKSVGEVVKSLRENKPNTSINKFAREYDIDRGNLSKIERGSIGCRLITAWKLAEASNVTFSEFAQLLERKLGKDFKFFDD